MDGEEKLQNCGKTLHPVAGHSLRNEKYPPEVNDTLTRQVMIVQARSMLH